MELVEEESQTPALQIINDLGGALSLYMGLSFITILEIFELVLNLFLAL